MRQVVLDKRYIVFLTYFGQCRAALITPFFLLPSFGVIPSTPLAIHTPLMPNQSIDVSLPLNTLGPVMKMEPLNNLQVRIVSFWAGGSSTGAQPNTGW